MCLDDREVIEHIHGGKRLRARRQKLKYPHPDEPLALRRLLPLTGKPHARIVLVHGLAQNRRTWRQRERSFEAALVERGYEVFNLELRGHGDSAKLGSPPASRVGSYIEDLRRILPLLEGELPVFAVGHSLGAGLLVRAAIEGLEFAGIIHYAGIYTFGEDNWFLQAASRLTQRAQAILPRAVAVSLAPAGRLIAWAPRLSDLVNRFVPISGWAGASMNPKLLAARVSNGFDRVGLGIWIDMTTWIREGGLDPDGHFARDTTPLLVLSGARDRLATSSDARACFGASGSEDKRLHIFDEVTHGYAPGHIDMILGEQAPKVVWPVVFEWLDRRARE